ncbi:MAG: radical SAM protein [Candidatus Zixiibacteriota bacterium]
MLALHPEYKLRKTKTNILLYRFDYDTMDLADQKALHPNAAILLSLFDGKNSIDDIHCAIKYLFEYSTDEASKILNNFIDEWKKYLTDTSKRIRYDKPNDFIIDSNQVNQEIILCESPLYIGLNITQQCNRNCIYCYAENSSIREFPEMTIAHLENIVNQIIECEMEFVILSGGDPFLRHEMFNILEMLNSANIPVQLSTKQFLNKGTINRLRHCGIEHIQLSIDSLDDNIAYKMIGVHNYASKMIDTLVELLNSGFKVSTNTVVCSINYGSLKNLVEKFIECGVSNIRLSQYIRSAYRHNDNLFITDKQAQELMEYVIELRQNKIYSNVTFGNAISDKKAPIEKRIEKFVDRSICSAGRMSMVIMPNGMVIPCEQLPCRSEFIVGDATKQTIMEIWNSEKFYSFIMPDRERMRNTICFNCKFYDKCINVKGLCMRDSWKAFNTPFQINPFCPNAESVNGLRLS